MKKNFLTIISSACLAYFMLATSFYTAYYSEDKTRNFDFDSVNTDSGFTLKEVNHMQDVSKIIKNVGVLYYLSIIVSLSSLLILWHQNKKRFRKEAAKAVFYAGIIPVAFVLILGLFSVISFDLFWNLFHKTLFPQGNWAFPVNSMLITLFPEKFFKEFITKTILITLVLSSISLLASYQSKSWRS